MHSKLSSFTLALTVALVFGLPASICFAESVPYEISGMTCQACVKSVKATVCKLKGVQKCEVEVGKVVLTTKDGQTIDRQDVVKAVKAAGPDFNVVTP